MVSCDDRTALKLVNLGARIRKLRKEQNLTQQQLANMVGISGNYVGDVERGQRNVGVINLIKLSEGLGCTLSDLTTDIESPEILYAAVPLKQQVEEKRAKQAERERRKQRYKQSKQGRQELLRKRASQRLQENQGKMPGK